MTADHWKHVARPFLEANPHFTGTMPWDDEGSEDEDSDDKVWRCRLTLTSPR
jgi:SET domain-containing protein 6